MSITTLEARMVIPCTLYKQTVDEYNDIRNTSSLATTCWYRDNNSVDTNNLNREQNQSDGMAWFRPTENIATGDILTVDSNSYRITRVIRARRLGVADVQFLKCDLERFDSFVS